MGEKISAFWIAVVMIVAIIWIAFTLSRETPEEIRPKTEPIPTAVTTETTEATPPEITREVVTITEVEKVDTKELEMLAHLIYGEAGTVTLPDKMQIYTGSVLLNRIKSPLFPNTMKECIEQKGQYSCLYTGYLLTPDERTYENAKFLLIHGSQLPDNVLFQSQFKQGDGVYEKVGNQYYCYKN